MASTVSNATGTVLRTHILLPVHLSHHVFWVVRTVIMPLRIMMSPHLRRAPLVAHLAEDIYASHDLAVLLEPSSAIIIVPEPVKFVEMFFVLRLFERLLYFSISFFLFCDVVFIVGELFSNLLQAISSSAPHLLILGNHIKPQYFIVYLTVVR